MLSAGSGGSSSNQLKGMYPIVLSHGMSGWGDDATGLTKVIEYWSAADYLRSQGAVVYSPTKTAFTSSEVRAQELKDKVNTFMASGGYTKIHIIGHSQGGLDPRYMITNLGMASKVVTFTSVNTPHRGSPIADLVKTVVPSWALPYVGAGLNAVLSTILYGGSKQNAIAGLNSLTVAGTTAFNNATPDVSTVKYYSYGSTITIPDLIQHPMMGILYPICGMGGVLNGQGLANDGLVPLSSQKWGTWKGGPSTSILVTGIDHIEAVNNTLGSWYDLNGYYLKIALNAKTGQ